jgi:hypothetical protein
MKPKWQPVALPTECAPFGEHPFQPYLIKDEAVVVAGGPSALFMVTVTHVPEFALTIPARVRISGFASHAGMLYVQDGPVLSRWSIADCHCVAAVNLLAPKQRHFRTTEEPDWASLHQLPATIEAKQTALQRARRKVEWLRMLEATEKQLATPSVTRTADETARLQQLAADMQELVGQSRDALRNELAAAQATAAALIISAPVVRTHQLGGKANAMVFVVGRDGTIHPLDKQLKHMGTARFDRNVRPSLAIAELNEGRSDDHACRLYYVTEEGVVRCIDGDALPPKSLHEWPGRGRTSVEPGVRARVESKLVWGNNAQDAGIFALPIERPGAASRVKVPPLQEWRWLEIRPDHSLAIVSTDTSCRLVSYALNANMADRFAVKPDRAPYFSSFLPQVADVHPLLVAEFERDAIRAESGVAFRLLIANDADVTVPEAPEMYAPFYPPLPTAVLEDELEGRGAMGPPVRIRTQPSISLQDAYLMARDKTIQQQLRDLAMNDWTEHMANIEKQYGSRANACAAIGDVAIPALSGRDALYCYAIGGAVTETHGRRAFEVLDDLRDLAKPVRLRITQTIYRIYGHGSRIIKEATGPIRTRVVTLRYDDGRKFDVTTNADGRVLLSREVDGKFLTMEPFGTSSFLPPHATRVFITRAAENQIELVLHKNIGEQ